MIPGVPRIINAYGTNTRLSGGLMAPEVVAAMAEAARVTVEMPALQAAASRAISAATGARPASSPPAPRPRCCWGRRPAWRGSTPGR
jgi:seryl-tRNA(Sec) selenium transferase